MPRRFQDRIDELRQLNIKLRSQLEQAETFIPELNRQIKQLANLQFAGDTVILGQVVYERHYAARSGPMDSSQVLQAALLAPGGIGVVLWDQAEYLAFRSVPEPRQSDVTIRFVSFEECEPAVRGLILPQVEPLMQRLYQLLGIDRFTSPTMSHPND